MVERGHEVNVYALPVCLEGKKQRDPRKLLKDVGYVEGKHFRVKADICYVTYNPLSFLLFQTSHPRIAGVHAQSYWSKPHLSYGIYPLSALIAYRLIGKIDLKGFDLVHLISKCFTIEHPNTIYIPNFVDSTIYHPTLRNGRFTVGYISRNNWQKGYDVALEIKKHLPEDIDFIFSNGEVNEEDMPMYVSKCHAVIVPSRMDTFGLSIVEAAMCGTPSVTSDLPAHFALNLPLTYGHNIIDYVRGILKLHWFWKNQPSYYQVYSEKLREAAVQQYDKKVVMDKLEQMFLGALS